MNHNTLKKLYNLFLTLEKSIPKTIKLQGHSIIIESNISVCRDLSLEYEGYEFSFPNKEDKKFFESIEKTLSIDLGDVEFFNDSAYEIKEDFEYKLDQVCGEFNRDTSHNIHSALYNNNTIRSFEEFKTLYNNLNIETSPVTIKVSRDYQAIIRKGRPVEVGCQSIDIDTIRKIVEEYDKL